MLMLMHLLFLLLLFAHLKYLLLLLVLVRCIAYCIEGVNRDLHSDRLRVPLAIVAVKIWIHAVHERRFTANRATVSQWQR
jgi:hypothetical protein